MERRQWLWSWGLVLGALAMALAMRLLSLEFKPPHHDEGVNGFFVHQMNETGYYSYDPKNFHGPLYFYVLWLFGWLFGEGLWQLRVVSALCGAALCALPVLAWRKVGIGQTAAIVAVMALSPSLVYFARHSIHESLLVALMLLGVLSFYRWAEGGTSRWLLASSASVAAMIATKETAVLFLGPAGLYMLAESGLHRGQFYGRPVSAIRQPAHLWRLAQMLAIAIAIHVLLFTGFFQHPQGVVKSLWRSFEAYTVWRTTSDSAHGKPWWYYAVMEWRYEALIVLMALPGIIAGWRVRFVRACGILGIVLVLGYSALSYKTPWLMINWTALLAVPAGYALARLGHGLAVRFRTYRVWVKAATAAVLTWPALQAYSLSFERAANHSEPIVYAQTTEEYWGWSRTLDSAARRFGHDEIRVRAILGDEAWPIPYTLQSFPHRTWGHAQGSLSDDVVIVDDAGREAVESRLRDEYYRVQFQLRPNMSPYHVYFRASMFRRMVPLDAEIVQPLVIL